METTRGRDVAVAELLGGLVIEIEPLLKAHNEATWQASVTGDEARAAEAGRIDAQVRKIFARREPCALLEQARAAGPLADPLLQRQLEVALDQFRANQMPPATIDRLVQMEKALDLEFNTFRADLEGAKVTDNQIRGVLQDENDNARRQRAWEAAKQIGARVVDRLLDLVRLRNEAARDLGYANYYAMMLELDELDEAELFALLDALEQGTRPLYHAYKRTLDAGLAKRFGVAVDALRPWHYSDPFFQQAPTAEVNLDPYYANRSLVELTERFFAAIGMETRDLLERADLEEKPGKSQHAFCMSVDRGPDIRVLCNIKPNEHWMSVMLHEFGHAVYDKYIDRSLPFLLRTPAHTLTTEASAMLFGRLSKNAAWLERYAGMSADEACRAAAATARAVRAQLLVVTRWTLVMCHMERALYRDPGQDLNALWWSLVERFQDVRAPERHTRPDWASKIHFSLAPVYYHNYTMGEVMASQLEAHIQRQVLGNGNGVATRYVSDPAVGEFLIDKLYKPGRSLNWRQVIERSTGSALSAAAFVKGLEQG